MLWIVIIFFIVIAGIAAYFNAWRYKPAESDVSDNEVMNETRANGNGVAILLKVLAIIVFILGFIGGLIMGQQTSLLDDSSINWGNVIVTWLSSLIGAAFLYGIGEIIDLLHKIYHKE